MEVFKLEFLLNESNAWSIWYPRIHVTNDMKFIVHLYVTQQKRASDKAISEKRT